MVLFELTREIIYYMMVSMTQRRGITRLFGLLAALALALGLSPGAGAGQEPVESFSVYLPLVYRAPSTIYGRVTDNGASAPGVSLTLWFYDGSNWSSEGVTITDSNGGYRFIGIPALLKDQKYFVEFYNTSDPSRLWAWETRQLTSFSAGSVVNIGNFDIAEIVLSSPPSGATVSLPQTFQWAQRPATPSDSYEFDLYEDCNPPREDCPVWWTDPPLGYVGSYNLTGLPQGFVPHTQYWWEIWVYDPDGGSGLSFDARAVTFNNTGLMATPVKNLPETQREQVKIERLLRRLQSMREAQP